MTYEDDLPEYVEEAFLTLRDENVNSPNYCLTQGNLYENLTKDTRVSERDAMDVTRKLNNGQVDEVEQLVSDILGEE